MDRPFYPKPPPRRGTASRVVFATRPRLLRSSVRCGSSHPEKYTGWGRIWGPWGRSAVRGCRSPLFAISPLVFIPRADRPPRCRCHYRSLHAPDRSSLIDRADASDGKLHCINYRTCGWMRAGTPDPRVWLGPQFRPVAVRYQHGSRIFRFSRACCYPRASVRASVFYARFRLSRASCHAPDTLRVDPAAVLSASYFLIFVV